MGQAKRRGTFEERKRSAIERDKAQKEATDEYNRTHSTKMPKTLPLIASIAGMIGPGAYYDYVNILNPARKRK